MNSWICLPLFHPFHSQHDFPDPDARPGVVDHRLGLVYVFHATEGAMTSDPTSSRNLSALASKSAAPSPLFRSHFKRLFKDCVEGCLSRSTLLAIFCFPSVCLGGKLWRPRLLDRGRSVSVRLGDVALFSSAFAPESKCSALPAISSTSRWESLRYTSWVRMCNIPYKSQIPLSPFCRTP